MRLTTFFCHKRQQPGSLPAFVPVSGEFEDVEAARLIAEATAIRNPRFNQWCTSFEIEDDDGNIVSKWTKEDDAHRT